MRQKKSCILVIVFLTMAVNGWGATSLTITVPTGYTDLGSGLPVFSVVSCMPNSLTDVLFTTGSYPHTSMNWVALDKGNVKYQNLGPTNGSWVAYIWSGTQVPLDQLFSVKVDAIEGDYSVKITKYDGTSIYNGMVLAGQGFAVPLSAVPGTTAQWRTKGYKFECTQVVPEPYGIFYLSAGVISLFSMSRRKR